MEPRATPGPRDEDRANKIVIGAIVGLVLLTIAVVAVASMQPQSSSQLATESAPAEQTVAALKPVATKPSPAEPKPAIEPTVTPPAVATIPRVNAAPAVKPVVKTLPEQMARRLPGSRQMIIVTGSRLGSNTGTLEVYNLNDGHWVKVLSTPANFGKSGLTNGMTRKQGHLNTPTGIWYLGSFLFGQHRTAPPGTKMSYRHITQNSWWSAERNSTYNTWVESTSHVSGEHLADSTVQYEYAFNSGYNAPPNQRVIGRGTAIFLHCSEPPGNALGKFTHGCIAIPRNEMLRVFAIVNPTRNPSFAIGTEQRGTPTAIWAY